MCIRDSLITVYNYTQSAETPALDDDMVAQFQGMENVVAATPMYQFCLLYTSRCV